MSADLRLSCPGKPAQRRKQFRYWALEDGTTVIHTGVPSHAFPVEVLSVNPELKEHWETQCYTCTLPTISDFASWCRFNAFMDRVVDLVLYPNSDILSMFELGRIRLTRRIIREDASPTNADNMLVIRPARASDAGELLTVQLAAFLVEAQRYGDPLLPPLRDDLSAVQAAIADPATVVLVAHAGARLIASARLHVEGTTGDVNRLVVAPDQQRRGIGRTLLKAVEDAAPEHVRRFELHTGGETVDNVAMYERSGYVREREGVDDRGVRLIYLAKERQ